MKSRPDGRIHRPRPGAAPPTRPVLPAEERGSFDGGVPLNGRLPLSGGLPFNDGLPFNIEAVPPSALHVLRRRSLPRRRTVRERPRSHWKLLVRSLAERLIRHPAPHARPSHRFRGLAAPLAPHSGHFPSAKTQASDTCDGREPGCGRVRSGASQGHAHAPVRSLSESRRVLRESAKRRPRARSGTRPSTDEIAKPEAAAEPSPLPTALPT